MPAKPIEIARRPFMSLTDVEKAVEQAAEAIAIQPPQEWAGWLVSLIIKLNKKCPPEDVMRENLEAVKADVEARLKEGHW
jgi:hypothetical protein